MLAEIVVFAAFPRFSLAPSTLVIIGALRAAARWSITAQEPPLLLLASVRGLRLSGLTPMGSVR